MSAKEKSTAKRIRCESPMKVKTMKSSVALLTFGLAAVIVEATPVPMQVAHVSARISAVRKMLLAFCFCLAWVTAAPAAGPYSYTLMVGPFPIPPSGPQLSGWVMSWQNTTLLKPGTGTCVDLQKETGFTTVGAPLTGWVIRPVPFPSVQFCFSGPGVYTIGVIWNTPMTPSELGYDFYFTKGKPPVTTGVYNNNSASTSYALGTTGVSLATGPSATLIIADLGSSVPHLPAPAWLTAIVRTSLYVAGPVTPPPGSPVEAVVGLVDLNGTAIGQLVPVTVTPGEVTSVDWIANTFMANAGHMDVIPMVSLPPGQAVSTLQLTSEVFDSQTSLGAVLIPPSLRSTLAPQGLAAGQTMRLIATAVAPGPCVATLSFAGSDGSPIGPTLQVDLMAGQSDSLDFASPESLQPGQRIEVQPKVTLRTGNSACRAVSEVYDQATGRTSTYQSADVRLAVSEVFDPATGRTSQSADVR